MKKNIFKVLSANGIVAIVGLLSSLFLPNILSLQEYAIYQTFALYLGYVALFHLGFPNGLSIKYAGKSLGEIDKSQYRAEMRILMILLSLFSIIVFIVFLIYKDKMLLYIAVMIFCYCFLSAILQLLQAWGDFGLYSILHIMMSAVPLLAPIIIYLIFHQASGEICITAYVLIYAITTVVFMGYHYTIIAGSPCNKLLSKEILATEKLGLAFHVGSYINILFHNIDKQFVSWFCTVQEFSYYSFAITMQSTMTIFLTAVSQPLFPYIASGKVSTRKEYTSIKRFLLMLGSASGVAYFACSFVVEHWIKNYIASLSVIQIYFLVFPAMAVINCLYTNLYKIRRMKNRYILDLFIMLGLAIVADLAVIRIGKGHMGIALVTVILYYIWLFYGTVIFRELRFDLQEIVFIIFFLLFFITIPKFFGNILGAIIYFIADVSLCAICFPHEVRRLRAKAYH